MMAIVIMMSFFILVMMMRSMTRMAIYFLECYLMIHLVFLIICDNAEVTIIYVDDEIRRREYQKKHHGRGSKKIGHAPSLRVFQQSDMECCSDQVQKNYSIQCKRHQMTRCATSESNTGCHIAPGKGKKKRKNSQQSSSMASRRGPRSGESEYPRQASMK